jgi:hypothetical protein
MYAQVRITFRCINIIRQYMLLQLNYSVHINSFVVLITLLINNQFYNYETKICGEELQMASF